jgi:hypothetical protein
MHFAVAGLPYIRVAVESTARSRIKIPSEVSLFFITERLRKWHANMIAQCSKYIGISAGIAGVASRSARPGPLN